MRPRQFAWYTCVQCMSFGLPILCFNQIVKLNIVMTPTVTSGILRVLTTVEYRVPPIYSLFIHIQLQADQMHMYLNAGIQRMNRDNYLFCMCFNNTCLNFIIWRLNIV